MDKRVMKSFVTLFINCPNIGLVKDVGQIPYHLGKKDDIDASLVSSKLDMNGPFIDDVQGLKLINIPLIFKSETITAVLYLLKNSKKIDWLNLYHCRKNNLIYINIYRFLNRKGKVYVKLDAGFETIKKLQCDNKYRNLFKKICKRSAIVSAESNISIKELIDVYPWKYELVPNGTNLVEDDAIIIKENIFLTVGRIGAPEKNNELLIQAFDKIYDKCDWDLYLVGGQTDSFKTYIRGVFEKKGYLKQRIKMFGEVTDKKQLARYYKKSKVFVMPSKYENFSLACAEAIVNGCYLVLSDQVTPKMDFTNNWEFGCESKVDNVDDLAEKMLIATQINNEDLFKKISDYGKNHFIWENIIENIYTKL